VRVTAAAGESADADPRDASVPVAAAVPDTQPDVSTRVVAGNFRYFEQQFGRERLLAAVAAIGGPSLDYILDPENFVSLEYLIRVARVLTDASGDPHFLRNAGSHQFEDPRAFGFVFYLVRSLGSPELYYRLAAKAAKTFNRVGEISIEDINDHHARMRYRSVRTEGSRLICEGRIGQLAGAPLLWGLPPASAREIECQVNGAPACVYELDWLPPFRPVRRALLGAVAGAIGGALVARPAGTTWGPILAAAIGAMLGALAALVSAYRADARAKARRLLDSATAETGSMAELGRRFDDVQRETRRRREAEAALVEAQKLEAVGRLSGGIAHDFNNILTVVLGSVRHAEGIPGTPPEVLEDLTTISEAATRAADLTRSLLTFARRHIVEPRVVALDDQVRRLERLLVALVGENVHLALDLRAAGVSVLIDPSQLEQVILNLAANARDAMPEGGALRIETRAEAGDVVLAVADAGHGMDEATRGRLFEPFFTTKPVGRGTGLGLASCHGIVSQAKGTITVDTAPGAGTTVSIHLPIVEAAPGPDAPGSRPAPRGGDETVLVVEDDVLVRRLETRLLTGAGYRVLDATGGEHALAVADREAGPIHLLVTDVVMPDIDGRALAERLQTRRPDLRVLFLSGYSHEVISQRGSLDAGIQLLRKPFEADDLLAKVRGILDANAVQTSTKTGATIS
jgi:signal transduction histidine kinase/ActR/RegA family two-component response regulator